MFPAKTQKEIEAVPIPPYGLGRILPDLNLYQILSDQGFQFQTISSFFGELYVTTEDLMHITTEITNNATQFKITSKYYKYLEFQK